MKRSILFPYPFNEDCRSTFAFTIELARRFNAGILVLNTVNEEGELEKDREKSEICCKLLEMKGYYHGWFNQWKAFDDLKIRILFSEGNLYRAISSAIGYDQDLLLVMDPKLFSHKRLAGDLFSGQFSGKLKVFLLPERREFNRPSPDLTGRLFQRQKHLYFNLILSETRIFNLSGDGNIFRGDQVIQQAV